MPGRWAAGIPFVYWVTNVVRDPREGESVTERGGRFCRWLCLIWCAGAALGLAVTPGCATHPAKLDNAPKLTSREGLLRNLGPPLRIDQSGEFRVWHYQRRYWNLFTLTSSTWLAQYSLDATGKVREVEIAESSISRRLWPRTRLPEDFQEFR
jgi:hypothetical protein